jgi:arylsulfatase A-like enzyme
VKRTGYTTNVITDRTLKWLKENGDDDEPFMLMYQHKAPHRNWQPGPRHLTQYDDEKIPEPPTLFDDYEGRGTAAKVQDMTIAETMTDRDLKLTGPPGRLTEEQAAKWEAAYGPKNEAFRKADLEGKELVRWKYQRYIKDYLRCVASVDRNLGRVLDYLDKAGLAENTIVIYSSDQGFYLGEHGWFDKRWMYEESLRTPLIIRWPGEIEPGSVNTDIVSPLDFPETFLDIAGADVPDDMQGRSMLPILKGETPEDWREYFYYHYYEYPGWHWVRRHYGVTDGRHKLIRFYNIGEWELYDLKFDANEMNNIYGNPAYAKKQKELKQELKRLRNELDVPEQDPPQTFQHRGRDVPRERPIPEQFKDLPRPQPPQE